MGCSWGEMLIAVEEKQQKRRFFDRRMGGRAV